MNECRIRGYKTHILPGYKVPVFFEHSQDLLHRHPGRCSPKRSMPTRQGVPWKTRHPKTPGQPVSIQSHIHIQENIINTFSGLCDLINIAGRSPGHAQLGSKAAFLRLKSVPTGRNSSSICPNCLQRSKRSLRILRILLSFRRCKRVSG